MKEKITKVMENKEGEKSRETRGGRRANNIELYTYSDENAGRICHLLKKESTLEER